MSASPTLSRLALPLLLAGALAACSNSRERESPGAELGARTAPAPAAPLDPGPLPEDYAEADALADARAEAFARSAEPTFEPDAPEGAAPSPSAYASGPAACRIAIRRTSEGVALKAIVTARRPLEAEYAFVVTKSGGAGSSDISQGGPLDLRAEESATVGSADVSMGRGSRLRATLEVRQGRRTICRAEERV